MRLPALVACLVFVATTAHAGEGAARGRSYLGVEGGMGVYNGFNPRVPGVTDTGFEVGGAAALRAGWQWRDHLRLDVLLTWEGVRPDEIGGRIDVAAATANVYYDFAEPDAWVRPYVGFGLGVAGGWLGSNLPGSAGAFASQSGAGMAYVISGGGRFPLTDRLSLACAWQFLGTVSLIDAAAGGSIDPTMHGFMVGLHHAF